MFNRILTAALLVGASTVVLAFELGLPPVPVPADNPQTADKIALGDRLFHDTRFSADGKVSCATCHAQAKGFTDNLPVSAGVNALTGTRNAPTVLNSAYSTSLFWDGREPDLEGQSKQPPINPVEGGLKDHRPIIEVIQGDRKYRRAFRKVFGASRDDISMDHVAMAIASFERTVVAGNSSFDRYFYGHDAEALTTEEISGFDVFTNKGRCVSCHTIEQTQALFTDNRFHNIGVGFKQIGGKEHETAEQFIKAKRDGANEDVAALIDIAVLTSKNISELGRFAVTNNPTEVGAFKTPTLRNIDVTGPYMHDGSLATLEDVVDFYNNGGRDEETDPLSGFQSGGIRPLDLTDEEKQQLVAFMKALTSPNLDRFTAN